MMMIKIDYLTVEWKKGTMTCHSESHLGMNREPELQSSNSTARLQWTVSHLDHSKVTLHKAPSVSSLSCLNTPCVLWDPNSAFELFCLP